MWVGVLGPLLVLDGHGQAVEVAGGRLRTLLARLAVAPGQLVTHDALVDAVWAEQPPAGAANALQSLVSRLRRALGPAARIESLPAGYRLSDVDVDLAEFERLLARAGQEPVAAPQHLAAALGLFRGPPFVDVELPAGLITRVVEQRLDAAEDLAELRLHQGAVDAALAGLREAVAEQPARERTRLLQLRILVALGRSAEALAAFEEHRRALAETLGADPAPALRDLHTRILRGELPAAPTSTRSTVGNLRAPLTSFVGRADEVARVTAALAGSRLVTLVGPGGAGKTRLATEVGIGLPDGTWLVELAGVGDGAEVPAAVLAALGHRDGGILSGTGDGPGLGSAVPTPVERVTRALRDRRALLLLDNCEHLLDACARVAEAVLGECPEVRVLITTREPLGIAGEVLCPLGPLAAPPSTVDVETAVTYPAVRLLVDRARAIRHDFEVTADNLADVVEVCRRLDGLPLAIELACARLRTLPLAEVAGRLGDRFRLLTGGSRTALPRHQTLQAVIGWSWDLFTPAEQRLARRLAVFAGGATVGSAEAVCTEPSTLDVLPVLGALVEKSFVQLHEGTDGRARYLMLDSVRAYAAGRLSEAAEAETVRQAHAQYFLTRLEEAEPALRTGEQLVWLGWLEQEYDNITAALRWAVDSGDAVTAARMVVALGWFWVLRGGRSEPTSWLAEVLAMPGSELVPRATLATAYAYDAIYHFSRQDLARAGGSAKHAHELAQGTRGQHPAVAFVDAITRAQRVEPGSVLNGLAQLAEHDDPWVAAAGLVLRGHVAENSADVSGAARQFRAARDAFAALGDRWGMTMALTPLAGTLSIAGDHAAAIAAMTEAAGHAEVIGADSDAAWSRGRRGLERLRAGDWAGAVDDLSRARDAGAAGRSAILLALAETGLGEVARHRGELAVARRHADAALAHLAGANSAVSPRIRAIARLLLARLELAGGDRERAAACAADALATVRSMGDAQSAAEAVEVYAELALAADEPAAAAELLGIATALRGTPDAGSPDVRSATQRVRAALGPAFAAAYGVAAALSPAEARERLANL